MIETALSEILAEIHAGSSTIKGLTVMYCDVHTLLGGVVLIVEGNGHSERRKWERGAIDPKVTLGLVTAEEIRELTELLLHQKVWEQPPVERMPEPDEVMATLTVRIAEVQIVCREWLRDGKQLPVVKDLMSRLVVSEYWERGTVNNEANIEIFRRAVWPILMDYGVIPSPSEEEIASENYIVTAPEGVGVRVLRSQGNNDPYDSLAASVTLESSNLIEPQSGASVQCMICLRYLAWSAPELEICLSGPSLAFRKLKEALEPALERCEFHPRAN